MTAPDDAYLLAGLRDGDPKVVEVWFATYRDRLLAFVHQKVDHTPDAEEITQETFINCLKHLPLFRGGSSVWTWMVSIAKHEVADYYRKKYARKTLHTLSLGHPFVQQVLRTPIGDAHYTSEKVKRVLSQMSAASVELLMAKYVDGVRVKELARLAARSPKAIESDLFRARREFRLLWAQVE